MGVRKTISHQSLSREKNVNIIEDTSNAYYRQVALVVAILSLIVYVISFP